MSIQILRQLTHPFAAARQAAALMHRFAAAVGAVTGAVILSALVVPAASATILIPNNGAPAGQFARFAAVGSREPAGGPAILQPLPAATGHMVSSGMPGWQIALGAALVAATAAVLLDRARAARRATPATTS
jgi:hypothetical protein